MRIVGQSHGQEGLASAKDSMALTEVSFQVLFSLTGLAFCLAIRENHLLKSTGSQNVAGVQETVEMAACLFDYFSSFSIDVVIFLSTLDVEGGSTKGVRNQFQRIIIVMDFCVEVRKVESIRNIILVNLTEVLVTLAA
jgi:hypothetical protein